MGNNDISVIAELPVGVGLGRLSVGLVRYGGLLSY